VGATLDYSLDISCAINPEYDIISTVTAACAPSGAGEMQISNLQFAGDVLTLTTSGGQPGRIYTVMFIVTMFDGRVFEFLVYQGVPPGLPGYLVPVPPSPGFGQAITTVSYASFDFTNPLNSGYISLLAGL
jgi:hypothetical protein